MSLVYTMRNLFNREVIVKYNTNTAGAGTLPLFCPDAYREGVNGYLFSTNRLSILRYKRLPIGIKPQVLKQSVFHRAKLLAPRQRRGAVCR